MKEKIMTIVMSVSMALIGVSTIINTGANLLGLPLPDLVIRLLGVVQLLSLGTLAWSTVKKVRTQGAKAMEGVKHETTGIDSAGH